MLTLRASAAALLLLTHGLVHAQAYRGDNAPTPQPVVTVTASVLARVVNDRMHATLRAEAENADAAAAAREVNARMGRALTRARATAGVQAASAGYYSFQVGEKDRLRWRVGQNLALEAADFPALSTLVSKLQSEDGLLVSGLNFSVSPERQRTTEDELTAQAIKSWQQRAQSAADGFGGTSWRPGRITVQGGDYGRPQPLMRVQAMAGGASQPINVEAGNTDVTVVVTGEVILETVRAPTR